MRFRPSRPARDSALPGCGRAPSGLWQGVGLLVGVMVVGSCGGAGAVPESAPAEGRWVERMTTLSAACSRTCAAEARCLGLDADAEAACEAECGGMWASSTGTPSDAICLEAHLRVLACLTAMTCEGWAAQLDPGEAAPPCAEEDEAWSAGCAAMPRP